MWLAGGWQWMITRQMELASGRLAAAFLTHVQVSMIQFTLTRLRQVDLSLITLEAE